MASGTLRTIITLAGTAAAIALASPVQAQMYSPGYKFIEAVKERKGTEATEMLREPGATVINSRDISSGETGLHVVVSRRDLTWTRWLLQEGANPNIADKNGRTPLILAAEIGFVEGVEALLARGAQVDIANATGETPLIAAVHARNIEMIETLMEGGADPDRMDNAGRSARDYAMLPGTPPRMISAIQSNESDGDAGEGRTYGPVF